MEYEVLAAPGGAIAFGARGLAEIAQNIRVILATLAWSCPLDRKFAGGAGYLDSPLPLTTAARVASIIETVEKHEPRVRVTAVTFEADPSSALDGRICPRIRFALRNGVSL